MYEESIQDVRQLLHSVTEFVNNLHLYPRRSVYNDAVLLALLSKTIRVGEAVCLLMEEGFHDEAFGMSRTMVDVAFSVRYLVNDPEVDKRCGQFAKYFAKDHENWTKMIQKYYPTLAVKYHPDHGRMLEVARTFRSPHLWHGGSTRDIAVESDLIERDEHGQPTRWEFDYEITYKWTSHFVHGTVVALDAHAMEPGVAFVVGGGLQQIQKGGMALFNAAVYLFKVTVLVLRGVKYNLSSDLEQEFDTLIARMARR